MNPRIDPAQLVLGALFDTGHERNCVVTKAPGKLFDGLSHDFFGRSDPLAEEASHYRVEDVVAVYPCIASLEELRALPDWTILRDFDDCAWQIDVDVDGARQLQRVGAPPLALDDDDAIADVIHGQPEDYPGCSLTVVWTCPGGPR